MRGALARIHTEFGKIINGKPEERSLVELLHVLSSRLPFGNVQF
jgi:hypothetical protein